MKINKKFNIAVINIPITVKSGNIPLANFTDILIPNSDELALVSGRIDPFFFENKKITIYEIEHEKGSNAVSRVFRYIYSQLKMVYIVLFKLKKFKVIFFFIGGEQLVLPLLVAKILRKKTVLLLVGNPSKVSLVNDDPFFRIINLLSQVNIRFSDRIIVYSNRIIEERNLNNFSDKILIASEHVIDSKKFYIKNDIKDRRNIVGYFGHLGELKGVMNLVKTIPKIIEDRDDLKFLIGGEGPVKEKIESFILNNNLSDNVKLVGWVKHDDLPDILNELKLLVLPSQTEGLPNIILEAMACGTPVLVTSVGAIPDIIKDTENGFIMDNNSMESIHKNILRALSDPHLHEISINSCSYVRKKYNYDKKVYDFGYILNEVI